jgi:hypothetical protein
MRLSTVIMGDMRFLQPVEGNMLDAAHWAVINMDHRMDMVVRIEFGAAQYVERCIGLDGEDVTNA